MSHTNSTSNYNLPQFLGSDKPAWLGDINPAMSAIDTQMKANADASTTAGTNATTALNGIGTLANLTTTEKTNLVGAMNEVNTGLGTVAGVASSASTNATTAVNGVNSIKSYFNLSQIGSVTASLTNGTFDWQKFSQAVNSEGSFGKLYGSCRMKKTGTTSSSNVLTMQTAFRPSSAISINGIAFYQDSESQFTNYQALIPVTINIATNGQATCEISNVDYNHWIRVYFIACVIFADDFGDTEQQQ